MKLLTDALHNHRVGLVLLRTYLSLAMLFHGYAKVVTGIDQAIWLVTGTGLPAFFAYGVYVGEVLAPALLLVGAYVRWSALVIAFNIVVAVGLEHHGQFTSLTKNGGWALELQGFYFVVAIAVAMTAHLARVEWRTAASR